MLKLILGRAKSGKTAAIMEEIHRRLDEPDGAVLLVPEQYSHEAEREMLRICGARLCLGAEVLSFTRLALRVESELGGAPQRVLDAGGRMLCLARAAEAVETSAAKTAAGARNRSGRCSPTPGRNSA